MNKESTLSVTEYALVSLPHKPRLVAWVTLVDLADDRLQFRGAEFAYTLHHKLFIEVFQAILPMAKT